MYHAPPVGLGVVQHFHPVALDEADVGFLAGIVVVQGDHYPSGVQAGVYCARGGEMTKINISVWDFNDRISQATSQSE